MKKICLLLFLASIAVGAIAELDLPEAPDGYKWIKILNDQSALLQPDGWFFKEVHPKDTDAYFVSKEDIDKIGKFFTGLTLNVFYRIDKKSDFSPSGYAKKMINGVKENPANDVLILDANKQGPLITFFFRIKHKHPTDGPLIQHYFYVANDQTGTLWMFYFEAPEKEWDIAWETGSVLLDNIVIESDI